MDDEVRVWFNPQCSQCRGAEEILVGAGVKPELIHYLDTPPSRPELESVIKFLGIASPREMMRLREPEAAGLESASDAELISAMLKHPILIERPIVIRGKHAVIARPPELLLALLD